MGNNISLDFSNDNNADFKIHVFGTSYILLATSDELTVRIKLSFKHLDEAIDICRRANGEPTLKELEDTIISLKQKDF